MTIDTIHDLVNWKRPEVRTIISDGILLPETRMIIFGAAKAWKSMLSLYTAFALCTGSPWFGFKTSKCVPFVYQVELPKAVFVQRALKFAKGANSYPPNVLFKTSHYIKLDSGYGISSIEKDVQEVRRRYPNEQLVLILDPLYKMMAGHITDEYDVRKLLDNLDEVKMKHNLTIIIIHHSRLTKVDTSGQIIDLGAEDMMGSSYLNNWCDTAIKVRLDNPHTGADRVEMTFELVRHAESVLPTIWIQWRRADLQPYVIRREFIDLSKDEYSIRQLDGDTGDDK